MRGEAKEEDLAEIGEARFSGVEIPASAIDCEWRSERFDSVSHG